MAYTLSITYKDDKVLNIVVADDAADSIIEAIKSNADHFYFFNELTKVGVWSSKTEIRNVILQPYMEPKDECEEQDSESIEPVQSGEESDRGREDEPMPEGEGSV